MKSQSPFRRVRTLLGGSGILLALSACTITARTPVEEPASLDPESSSSDLTQVKQKDEKNEDGDWIRPKAERVQEGDVSPEQVPGTTPHVVAENRKFVLGHAQIQIGKKPPWDGIGSTRHVPQDQNGIQRQGAWGPWQLKKTIWVGQGYLHQAAFTADQMSIVTLSTQSGEIYQYDLAGKLLRKIALPLYEEFEHVEFEVLREIEGRSQLVVTRKSGMSILDLESGKFDIFDSSHDTDGISHTGHFGLYGISSRNIQSQTGQLVLQWMTGDIAASLVTKNRPDDWALSADGKVLAIQYYPANEVDVLDLNARKKILSLPSPKWGGTVALSPDGSLIALGGEKLIIARLPGGELIAEDQNYENNIHKIRFTQDGTTLLVSAYDGKARSYTLPTDLKQMSKLNKPQKLAHSGQANVYALGLSKSEENLVTSSGDKTLKLWTRRRRANR